MKQNTKGADYYKRVGKYYDIDCGDFEKRYWENQTLQIIRQSFREKLKRLSLENKCVLEIGIGPGIDIAHFSKIYPESSFYGIDISPEMVRYAQNKVHRAKSDNVTLKVGSVEDISSLFPGQNFDVIYVFFGALNTVHDLAVAFRLLNDLLTSNGKMVLTFVNKYYLFETLIFLLKMKPKKAFARFGKWWYGYSNEKVLESHCYSVKKLKKIMKPILKINDRSGYSIIYPAWYRNSWVKRMKPRMSRFLWWIDQRILNHTFAWKYGEYTLFSLEKANG